MSKCRELIKEFGSLKVTTTRLAILFYLMVNKWSKLGDIAKHLGLTKSTVWKHLKEMQEEGLVKVKYSLGRHPQMNVALTEKGAKLVLQYAGLLEKVIECLEGEGEKSEKGESEGVEGHEESEDRSGSTHSTDQT
ncbi:transcriptional regulator [Ignicoccus hospitalis]|uniref:Transcriptional regulator, ArsR family n=1 Tax=Ignicoccus hospitalis (strain KIN4/I / DSM 18386 / JCM 14125) TaxID=453591 RepID=A8A8E6_IGNH4|nr:transcriptional regulator [Ignicoccus hospitalis]ABU81198.1 transcriptional regulator, ArsR family [Ignicoccus hospitalis KIN4/I]HIH90628.1 ArsR family transcriptional regulator [Desulfurococcaceae archaeon]